MKIILATLLISLTNLLYGQKNNNALQVYAQALAHQSHLSNGTAFETLPVSEEEFPFFSSYEPASGIVFYQGDKFDDVFMQYNLVTDQLIIEDPVSKNEIQLIKASVQGFTVLNHSFIQITNHPSLPNGFYDLLFNDQSRVLVKHEKKLQFKVWGYKLVHYYILKTKIYIESNGQVFSIRKKKNVLVAFNDHRDLIEKSLRQKKIRFKENPEKYCKEAAIFYTTFSHE